MAHSPNVHSSQAAPAMEKGKQFRSPLCVTGIPCLVLLTASQGLQDHKAGIQDPNLGTEPSRA